MTDAIICNQCGAAVRTDVGLYFTVHRTSPFNTYGSESWSTRHFCSAKCLSESARRLYEAVLHREGVVEAK